MTRTLLIIISLIGTLYGCSVTPSEGTAAGAITDYFEAIHYRVIDLKIGKIKDTPLSEKTYMGRPGYVVEIVSITLEPQEDKSAEIKKGKQLTFKNARIRVTQDIANKNTWRVSIISGISVP